MSMQHATWRHGITIAAVALAPLCMGNNGCEDEVIGEKVVCDYGGKTRLAGESFPSTDGCNTCSCSDKGAVACTARWCEDAGAGCDYAGMHHQVGDTFASSDGCNTCSCEQGGTIACTEKACLSGCDYEGKHYDVGVSFPVACNTCSCGADGKVGCTRKACVGGCDFGGKHYDEGSSFPSADGCNQCSCTAGGQVACTARACALTCSYSGKTYQAGDAFSSSDGCNSCSCGSDGQVACTERACVCEPHGWTTLRVTQGAGPCPPNQLCSNEWKVTPDRKMEARHGDSIGLTDMGSADFCSLVDIVGSESFQASMRQGFKCDVPPTDIGYSIELTLENETLKQTVTGCVTTGPKGNSAAAVVDLVNNY